MAVYEETIKLDDNVSAAAKASAKAVAELGSGLEAAQKDLVKFAALGDQVNYDKSLAKMAQYSAALAKLPPAQQKAAATPPAPDPAPIAQAGQAMTDLGKKTFDASNAINVGKETIGVAVAGIKQAFASLAAGDVKGAIAGVTDAVAGIAKALDLVVPGLGEVVGAVVKIAGGLAGITVGLIQKGAEFAIEASQAKQAMLGMFDAMGGGVTTGEELDDMLSGLADRIGISKDSLQPLTLAFLKMGVTGKDALEKLTLAAISATAIAGAGGAEAFTTLQKKVQLAAETGGKFKLGQKQLIMLGEAGLKVSDIAAKMGMETKDLAAQLEAGTVDAKKFGEAMTDAVIAKGATPLERLGSSFGEIKKKFMQDIGDLFEDIDVAPFMKEVKELFGIFGQGTASGQALKAGIGGFFKEVFAIATKVVPMIKHFLLDMVIYGLQAYIATKPIVAKLKELWKSADEAGVLDAILNGLKVAFLVIGGAVLLVVGLFGTLMAISVAVGVAIWTLIGFFVTLGEQIVDGVVTAGKGVIDWLIGLGVQLNDLLGGWPAMAVQAAIDFVKGLVDGITSGAALVADAARGVASGAVDAVTGFLGIHSPSTVMAEIGGHTAAGMAGGIEGGAPDVHGAAAGMGSLAVAGASGGAEGGGAGKGGGNVITVYVQVDGAQASSAQELTDAMVAATFERMALAAGL